MMRELAEYLARSLVDRPDAVEVRQIDNEDSIVLEIRVDPADVGKVIGKQGRIVRAIRTVVRAAATRIGKRVEIEVI